MTEKLWTPANVVTVVRICLIPLFVVVILCPWQDLFPTWTSALLWKPWIAAFVFAAISATDAVDGHLARSRNEVTDFGKFVDPLADKLLVTAALLSLIELGLLPAWIALVIISREFIVSGIRMLAASKGMVIAASWYGKAKTVTQIIAIILFIVKDSTWFASTFEALVQPLTIIAWVVMYAAVALTIISMVDYFVKSKEVLGIGKSKSATNNNANEAMSAVDGEVGVDGDVAADRIVAVDGEGKDKVDGAADTAIDFKGEVDALSDKSIEQMLENSCNDAVLSLWIDGLAQRVISAAKEKQITIGTAESLTGGLMSAKLTEVPGSSSVLLGGITSYSPLVKHSVLQVKDCTIETEGVVSEQCATEMAQGAQKLLGVTLSISMTGIAGPTGALPGKPVGTVFMAIATASECLNFHYTFQGNREEVRLKTVEAGLLNILKVIQNWPN